MISKHTQVNVLIVDDNPSKLAALAAALDGMDIEIATATSGTEALHELLAQDFAVVLLDVNMPVMDGFETAAMIRHRQKSEHLPIIFITAERLADEERLKGYELGAVDYITSPVLPQILRSKVAVFADLYRLREQSLRYGEELFIKNEEIARQNLFLEQRLKAEFERKQAIEELRESEGRFYQMANSLPQLVWTCQPDGQYDFLSQQWVSYTGIPEAPQLGFGWLEQLHPDDRAPTVAAWQAAAASGTDFHVEFRIRRHDGEYRWFDTRAVRLSDAEGRTVKWFGSNTDISERKITEKALLIQNRISSIFLTGSGDEMFNEVLKIILEELRSPYGVFGYLDRGGNLVVPSMTRHIWDKCQVADKSLFFPCSTWGESSWPRAIREKKWNYTNEASIRIPDGHIGISRHVSFPILFQGEVIGLFQVANKDTDYTEDDIRALESIAGHVAPILNTELQRKRAEEELQESEKRFRTTFEQAAVGFAHVGADGRWLRVNQKLCDILGYTHEELLALSFQDITHPDDLDSDLEYVRQLLAATIPTYSMEKRYLRRNGGIVWVSLTVALVRKDSGEPDYFISVIQDISARKRMEQEIVQLNAGLEQRVIQRTAELQAANADLEGFVYSVSHDLRAPLRAIDGFASILREDYAPRLDAEGQRLLQVVSNNAKKMGQLIDDILAFSRAGRLELRKTTLDMNALVQQAWEALEPRRIGRIIEFHATDLPGASGDSAALRQVWQNLLDNAIKFTRRREAALIEVSGQREANEIVYSIRDNGAGFDMAYVAKLFGLFQRLHGMEEFEGTGVGLAIVKRFIMKHGGRVWAEGRAGEGATFWFSLPAN